jgi:hypothetical protein
MCCAWGECPTCPTLVTALVMVHLKYLARDSGTKVSKLLQQLSNFYALFTNVTFTAT